MAETNNPEPSDRREAARRAMEGEERTRRRAAEEEQQQREAAAGRLNKRLDEIRTDKEKLELAWIDLDNNKKAIRANLDPVLEEEKQVETEEANLESEEARTGVPTEKHSLEERRWAIQAKRQEVEKRKWLEEEKMIKVDQKLATNTQRYRQLLDEEEQINNQLKQLKIGGDGGS